MARKQKEYCVFCKKRTEHVLIEEYLPSIVDLPNPLSPGKIDLNKLRWRTWECLICQTQFTRSEDL